jgi:hypothetical protein
MVRWKRLLSGKVFEQIMSLQSLAIEEAESGHMLPHTAGVQLSVLK